MMHAPKSLSDTIFHYSVRFLSVESRLRVPFLASSGPFEFKTGYKYAGAVHAIHNPNQTAPMQRSVVDSVWPGLRPREIAIAFMTSSTISPTGCIRKKGIAPERFASIPDIYELF
ncbi:hypothetical protein V2G26_018542 [Clonostachys chloroleuca]